MINHIENNEMNNPLQNVIIENYKKEKSTNSIEDYMNCLYSRGEKNMLSTKNPVKPKEENLIVPTIYTYNDIMKYNYNVQELKQFAKHYKLKIGGNKKELIRRIFLYLYFSSFIIKIQKRFRGLLQRTYNQLHGPAFFKRALCTNETDFVTMEEIGKLPYTHFFSYKDLDGFVYGFEISSLYNLIKNNDHKNIKNPYNRNLISMTVLNQIKTIIRFSDILKKPIKLVLEDEQPVLSDQKSLELRALSLFQKIDDLGNYSDPKWFLSLNRHQTLKFLRELIDIWTYRAQLPDDVKRNILPPNGHFFVNPHLHSVQMEENMIWMKKKVLDVIELLVTKGVDRDSRALGAYYILAALTMVNYEAASALPWLYQSVAY